MKIDIIAHDDKPDARSFAKRVCEYLISRGIDSILLSVVPLESDADAVITVGGDGTILKAIGSMKYQLPIIGINMGNVGFLADIERSDYLFHNIESFLTKMSIEERMRIDVHKGIKEFVGTALNDVAISSARPGRMIKFSLIVDGLKVHSFRADGIIISTPTGSTSYGMSAGGPIVDPLIEGYIVVPIAPYLLSSRPQMISTKRTFGICVDSDEPSVVIIDGVIVYELGKIDFVGITKSGQPAKFIDANRNFFVKVDDKLRRC